MRHLMPPGALLGVLLVAAAACTTVQSGAGGAGVRLLVARPTVAAGDTVTITLENGSRDSIGYNLCTSGLERRSGGGWSAVPNDRMCTMELRTLAPEARATYPLDIPSDLAPGEYRVVTGVERLAARERLEVTSEPFTVAASR